MTTNLDKDELDPELARQLIASGEHRLGKLGYRTNAASYLAWAIAWGVGFGCQALSHAPGRGAANWSSLVFFALILLALAVSIRAGRRYFAGLGGFARRISTLSAWAWNAAMLGTLAVAAGLARALHLAPDSTLQLSTTVAILAFALIFVGLGASRGDAISVGVGLAFVATAAVVSFLALPLALAIAAIASVAIYGTAALMCWRAAA